MENTEWSKRLAHYPMQGTPITKRLTAIKMSGTAIKVIEACDKISRTVIFRVSIPHMLHIRLTETGTTT